MKPFDFRALDDLSFAALDGKWEDDFQQHRAMRLGPVLELAVICQVVGLSPPTRASWLNVEALSDLLTAPVNSSGLWIGGDGRRMGLLRLGRSKEDLATLLIAQALQTAASDVGFGKVISGQLAAAMCELAGNIEEHSQNATSGVVAFHATDKRIEFVVTDRGVGVLESLRSSPRYDRLDDALDALELTLTEGISRFDVVGRGRGFRPIFVGLANQHGVLRFRSGDGLVAIDGRLGSGIHQRTARRVNSNGFFISVDVNASASTLPTL